MYVYTVVSITPRMGQEVGEEEQKWRNDLNPLNLAQRWNHYSSRSFPQLLPSLPHSLYAFSFSPKMILLCFDSYSKISRFAYSILPLLFCALRLHKWHWLE